MSPPPIRQDHTAEHEVDQAKALLAQYRSDDDNPLDRWVVTTPASGLVLKVMHESETIMRPGTPILKIGDPRDLKIVVDVLSTDAVEIVPSAAVMIDHWGSPGVLAEQVRRVEPAAFTHPASARWRTQSPPNPSPLIKSLLTGKRTENFVDSSLYTRPRCTVSQ